MTVERAMATGLRRRRGGGKGGMGELYEEGVEVYSVYISRIIVSVQSVGWRSLLTSQI